MILTYEVNLIFFLLGYDWILADSNAKTMDTFQTKVRRKFICQQLHVLKGMLQQSRPFFPGIQVFNVIDCVYLYIHVCMCVCLCLFKK